MSLSRALETICGSRTPPKGGGPQIRDLMFVEFRRYYGSLGLTHELSLFHATPRIYLQLSVP